MRVLTSDDWPLICIALETESMYWFSLVKSLLFRCQQYLAHNANWEHLQDRIGIWMCWFLRRGENQSTQRKTSWDQQQTQPTYMTARSGVQPGPHWWEASALTTVPSLLPHPKSSSKQVNKETNWGTQGYFKNIAIRLPPSLHIGEFRSTTTIYLSWACARTEFDFNSLPSACPWHGKVVVTLRICRSLMKMVMQEN